MSAEAAPPIDAWLAPLLRTSLPLRVLDVACGRGTYLRDQAAAVRTGAPQARVEWLGLDPDPRLSGATAEIKPVVALAEAIPLADGAIDYAFCAYALHHFQDWRRALREVARVCRAGARIKIVNVDPGQMRAAWLYRLFPEAAALDLGRFPPLDQVVQELEALDFQVTFEITKRRTWMAIADVAEMVQERRVPQLELLTDDVRDRGLARLREEALDDVSTKEEVASYVIRAVRLVTTRPA